MEIRDNLLDNDSDIIGQIENNLEDLRECKEIITSIVDRIEEETATSEMLRSYKSNLIKLESIVPDIRSLLDRLKEENISQREMDIWRKLNEGFKKEETEYYQSVDRMNRLAKSQNFDKKLRDTDVNSLGSVDSREAYVDDDAPVLEVYDQEEEVIKRGNQFKEIKKEAEVTNQLAGEITRNIYDQDAKIDGLTRKMAKNVEQTKAATKNLREAKDMGNKNKKKIGILVMIIVLMLLFMIIVVLAIEGVF